MITADVSASSKSTAEQLKKMSMEKIVLDAEQKRYVALPTILRPLLEHLRVLQLVEAKTKPAVRAHQASRWFSRSPACERYSSSYSQGD